MSQTKLFSNLYLAKFLDTSAKPFYPCIYHSSNYIRNDWKTFL